MINFCSWSVCPRITCDKVSSEGYEVENLIAKDVRLCQQGFLADHFINAPLCVTVSFPCNVHIHSIIINPVVGAQKSTVFEIFSQSREMNASNSWFLNSNSISSNVVTNRIATFMPIGKVTLQEPRTVIFQNSCFAHVRQDYLHRELPSMPNHPDHHGTAYRVPLSHHKAQTLTRCSDIRIRICRTKSGSVPAMKLLEIWGQPSRSCDYALCKAVYEKFSMTVLSQSYDKHNDTTVSQKWNKIDESHNKVISDKHVGTTESDSLVINEVSIPDEFIDPITCDLITLPVLLPSGKTVDQQTLDKYIHMEEAWGRAPGDPFTGIPFSDICKPITNSSLKIRIDNFVMKNSDKLHSVPRMLGRAEDSLVRQNIVNDDNHIYNYPDSYSSKIDGAKVAKPKQQQQVNSEIVNNPIYHPNYNSVSSRMYSGRSCIDDRVRQKKVCVLIDLPKGGSSPVYKLTYDGTSKFDNDDDDDDDCVIVGVSSHFDKHISNISSKRKTCANKVELGQNSDSKSKRSKAHHGLYSHRIVIDSSDKFQAQMRQSYSSSGESAMTSSHENRLTFSLDDALSATLSSLPSYCAASKSGGQVLSEQSYPCSGTELLSQQECDQICPICSKKKCDLYELLCSHIVCRDCLKKSTTGHNCSSKCSTGYICLICKKTCISKDIRKLNF